MKIKAIFILFLLSSKTLVAQEEHGWGLYQFFAKGDTLVLSNGGHIRSSPSRNGKSIDQLPIGSVLYLNEECEQGGIGTEVIYNIREGYYPVQYEKAGESKTGYVWGGLIARTHSVDKNGNRYIFGVRNFDDSTADMTVAVIRIDAKTNKVHEQLFSYTYGYQSSYESKVLGNMGLDNLQQIFRVGILGEACGIFTTYDYYGWNGKQFIKLPSKNSVGDAGIYSYGENLLFPSEHKLGKDLIIIESETYTVDYVEYEELAEPIEVERTVEDVKVYRWDGKSVRLLEPKKIPESD